MGTNYYAVSKKPTCRQPIHIGKASIGWKFLFHRVSVWENYIDEKPLNTAKQWYEFLRDNNDRIYILNEYDEVVPPEWLIALIEKKQEIQNVDNFTHADNIDGYRFTDGEFS